MSMSFLIKKGHWKNDGPNMSPNMKVARNDEKGYGWLGSSSAGPSKRVDTKFGCSYHMCTPQQVLISLSFQEHGPTNTTKYIEKMESCKWSKIVHLKGYVSLGIQTTKCMIGIKSFFITDYKDISLIDAFINTKSRSTELASICFQISLELYLVSKNIY